MHHSPDGDWTTSLEESSTWNTRSADVSYSKCAISSTNAVLPSVPPVIGLYNRSVPLAFVDVIGGGCLQDEFTFNPRMILLLQTHI